MFLGLVKQGSTILDKIRFYEARTSGGVGSQFQALNVFQRQGLDGLTVTWPSVQAFRDSPRHRGCHPGSADAQGPSAGLALRALQHGFCSHPATSCPAEPPLLAPQL